MSNSLGSRLGTSSTQDYVLLGVVALVGYVLYEVVKGIRATGAAVGAAVGAATHAAASAYTDTTSALGSGLYSLFGPDDKKLLGSMSYFLVNFPDGTRHAVPNNSVNASGMFTWTGYPPNSQPDLVLTLVKDNQGAWYATSDTPVALDPSALQQITFNSDTIDIPNVTLNGGRWR